MAVALCTLDSGEARADEAINPLARDLIILTRWYEGEFDNEEQRWFHTRSRASSPPPIRLHTFHKRVDLPAFGDHVFYVEEYKDHDPREVVRQRLVVFSTDLQTDAIRMQQGFFAAPDTVLGAHRRPELLASLARKDVSFLPGCDVLLRRRASQFEGSMLRKTCVFGKGPEERYAVHDITLSETKLWRVDATFLTANDRFHAGTAIDQPIKLRRAKRYLCDVRFYDTDRKEQKITGLSVHSQGGTATAVRASDQQAFDVLLREKEYPYYDKRPDFLYYAIRKAGAPRSVAYGVADAQSRQFGLNNGTLSLFCHREGYEFHESTELLDAR